jgi:hypothetical protein
LVQNCGNWSAFAEVFFLVDREAGNTTTKTKQGIVGGGEQECHTLICLSILL